MAVAPEVALNQDPGSGYVVGHPLAALPGAVNVRVVVKEMPQLDPAIRSAKRDHYLEIPMVPAAEVGLDEGSRPGHVVGVPGDPLPRLPGEVDIRVVVEEVPEFDSPGRGAERNHYLEVLIGLDEGSRAGHVIGVASDPLAALPGKIDIRVVVEEVPEFDSPSRGAERDHDFEVLIGLDDCPSPHHTSRHDHLPALPQQPRGVAIPRPVGERVPLTDDSLEVAVVFPAEVGLD